MYDDSNFYNSFDSYRTDSRLAEKRAYFTQTYGLMAVALAVTFAAALITARFFPQLAYSTPVVITLCVAELVVVIAFSRSITRVSSGGALGMFLLYSCLTGVSLSSVFLLFDVSSIFLCFLATAVSFGAMALYGMRSQKNLASWGGTLFGALIGLLVLTVASFFLRLPMLDLFICVLGLLIFLGLTAYDTRKLSMMYDQACGTELADRYSIYAALQLYLDFINIFLYLLRLLGYANRD